jgi:hypothetical protein
LLAVSTTVTEEQQRATEPADSPVAMWVAILAGMSLVIGGLSAVFWATVVDLPTYRILPDGSATISERGITEIVASDVWFVITGALVGAGLGLVTWKWFRTLGWPTALLAAGSGLLAGIVCWQVGELLGPGSFAERLTGALPGTLVPIPLELRSLSALAVWGFAAVTPVLLASSLGPDDEDQATRWRRHPVEPETEESGTIDDRGVLTTPDEPS